MTEFGVLLPHPLGPGPGWFDRLADLTVSAERAGFHSVWLDDPPATPHGPEAVTLLGGLGVRTSTVRLGVLADLSRRPAGILAKMVTTIDVVTGGRAGLGLGLVPTAGGPGPGTPGGPGGPDERESDDSGPGDSGPDDPGKRPEELEEAVSVCHALFVADDVTFTGRHNRLHHARNLPPPVRAGGPVLVVGGPESLLPFVARHAYRLGCRTGAGALGARVARHHRACEEVGRDPADAGVTWFVPRGAAPAGPVVAGAPDRPEALVGWVQNHVPDGVDEVVFDFGAAGPDAIAAAGAALGLDPQETAP